jgi:hypothetical protein
MIVQEDQEKCAIYLDDGVTIVQDIENNLQQSSAAFPFAVHIMSRSQSENKPIPRAKLLALKELASEGGLAEQQIFLG